MNPGKKAVALVLVATIGLGLFVGLASAVSGNDPLSQILQLLTGINTSINQLNTSVNKLNTSISQLSTEASQTQPRYIELHNIILSVTIPIDVYPLPGATRQSYGGHITLSVYGSPDITLEVLARSEGGTTSLGSVHPGAGTNTLNLDFACESLELFILNSAYPPTSGALELKGVIQYTISTNGSSLMIPP